MAPSSDVVITTPIAETARMALPCLPVRPTSLLQEQDRESLCSATGWSAEQGGGGRAGWASTIGVATMTLEPCAMQRLVSGCSGPGGRRVCGTCGAPVHLHVLQIQMRSVHLYVLVCLTPPIWLWLRPSQNAEEEEEPPPHLFFEVKSNFWAERHRQSLISSGKHRAVFLLPFKRAPESEEPEGRGKQMASNKRQQKTLPLA